MGKYKSSHSGEQIDSAVNKIQEYTPITDPVRYSAQTLTTTQKNQARKNIGAASAEDAVPAIDISQLDTISGTSVVQDNSPCQYKVTIDFGSGSHIVVGLLSVFTNGSGILINQVLNTNYGLRSDGSINTSQYSTQLHQYHRYKNTTATRWSAWSSVPTDIEKYVTSIAETHVSYNQQNPTDPQKEMARANLGAASIDQVNNRIQKGGIKTINGQSLEGSGNINLSTEGVDLSDYATKQEVENALARKQDNLVSNGNIKTINGQSIVGPGNITITGGGGAVIIDDTLNRESPNAIANKAVATALEGKQSTLTSGSSIKTISGEAILGSGNLEIFRFVNQKDDSLVKLWIGTQAEYDALESVDPTIKYLIEAVRTTSAGA